MAPAVALKAGAVGQRSLQVLQKAAKSPAGLFYPCVRDTTPQDSANSVNLTLKAAGVSHAIRTWARRVVKNTSNPYVFAVTNPTCSPAPSLVAMLTLKKQSQVRGSSGLLYSESCRRHIGRWLCCSRDAHG